MCVVNEAQPLSVPISLAIKRLESFCIFSSESFMLLSSKWLLMIVLAVLILVHVSIVLGASLCSFITCYYEAWKLLSLTQEILCF